MEGDHRRIKCSPLWIAVDVYFDAELAEVARQKHALTIEAALESESLADERDADWRILAFQNAPQIRSCPVTSVRVSPVRAPRAAASLLTIRNLRRQLIILRLLPRLL